jgi:hypothetical protein
MTRKKIVMAKADKIMKEIVRIIQRAVKEKAVLTLAKAMASGIRRVAKAKGKEAKGAKVAPKASINKTISIAQIVINLDIPKIFVCRKVAVEN